MKQYVSTAIGILALAAIYFVAGRLGLSLCETCKREIINLPSGQSQRPNNHLPDAYGRWVKA